MNANRITNTLLRSPLLWGTGITVVFFSLLDSGCFPQLGLGGGVEEYFKRYFAGHWVEYVEGALFFLGMSALTIKLVDILVQFTDLKHPMLPATGDGVQTAADCPALIAVLSRLPQRLQEGYLATRLQAALAHVQRVESADKLEEELKFLADADATRSHGSYALVRIIVWAIPIMGFLGTVIGITMAIANISPQQLEESLPEVTAGLGVAFDTTAVALTQSIFLMFGMFVCDKIETRLLDKVDARVLAELAGRFENNGGGTDPQVAAVRRMADAVVQSTERIVNRQIELWQGTIQAAQQQWSQSTGATQQQLESALTVSLTRSLQSHAQQLAASSQQASEQNQKHWAGVQQALNKNAEAALAQQRELSKQTEVLRQVVEATGQLTKLEDALNRNLSAVAGSQNFEETVQSLAAVIHLLNARLNQVVPPPSSLNRASSRTTGQAA